MRHATTLKRIISILINLFITLVLITTIYIMANGLGLVDGLDFGAGAYYYADIPEFGKYVNKTHFISDFPMWLHIVLFLGWGALMYGIWSWLDKKLK